MFRVNPYRGVLIVIEGIDGSGKSLQVERLAKRIAQPGSQVVLTEEPWFERRNEDALRLKRSLAGKEVISPVEHQRLHVRLRERHLAEFVIPALQQRAVVITDRYYLSTFAYGAASGSMSFDDVVELHSREAPHSFFPDCTIILDLPVDDALARLVKDREALSLFEKRTTLERVQRAYREFADIFPDRNVYLVDATGTIEEVSARVEAIARAAITVKSA